MNDCTTHAASTFVLRRQAPGGLARRYPSAERALHSQAGLHPRPWLGRLRRALSEGLFVLHYQPIISLKNGMVCHHEALLRLADGLDEELVPPSRFLPAAERYGLVREIDRMVLSETICLMGAELADRHTPVAVNLSALSVTGQGTLVHIERLLALHDVDPGRLILEVTETAAISDMSRASDFCRGVQQLGCAVALDDFGAGFGSFQYLKHLPFSHLKIDGDFIRRLPVSRTDQLVVRALAGVVRGMGRRTIAEFVGDQTTMSMLRSYGVDYAQGFEVGRPSPHIPLAA
jgi:EAL domain-containing protein (putative c-di-GMP-specific phosphodiesterase class I)